MTSLNSCILDPADVDGYEPCLHELIRDNDDDENHETIMDIISDEHTPLNQCWRGSTALGGACWVGNVRVVERLLQYPWIDINKGTPSHHPADLATDAGHLDCLHLLLTHRSLRTPDAVFSTLTSKRDIKALKMWIVSGVEFRASEFYLASVRPYFTKRESEFGRLWLDYAAAPDQTRHELRVETGWYRQRAADLFVLCIFTCDGYLDMEDPDPKQEQFFSIVRRLPMEIQMLICNRAAHSSRDIVGIKQFEQSCQQFCAWLKKTM